MLFDFFQGKTKAVIGMVHIPALPGTLNNRAVRSLALRNPPKASSIGSGVPNRCCPMRNSCTWQSSQPIAGCRK